MSNQAVDVEILGKLTRVNCPAGQEESLIEAAADLDNRLKEMAERTKVTNEVKLLTIAALNICYELQTKQNDNSQKQNALTERMELLTTSLEDALSKVKQGQQ
ncbi:MAG: cell division protein ZapA [Vibrio gallaecicus]|uniref:cell division protein ZapA n=1 Tax=Vibrio sp. 99-70-13A1 TaxID=2607601 RepID=UPI00149384D5|nr:cell division protein ZapA [Vibrio sp. 99-70-13A1]NOH98601.1 cell division protein ZapA [Vibrio sp. 99-70-13A1]